ncbi:hypothetical protein [Actibacterium sp. 188UL27-1]|uniref:hypothetical protein n=1 Tax=Actibacterium sp. 188UL27-1 TaxID=2786961 RepID=UPI001957B141|nr:hypothetical protein [Actibacterium sp. 188UL27-1]MBM7069609.1 hypothetical protein [Actibacterium sp. 188UL27-1]
MTFDPEVVRYGTLFSRAVACELRINDIPVMAHAEDLMINGAQPLRQYILKGQNAAALVCRAPGDGTGPGRYAPMALAEARIADFREGETLSDESGIEYARFDPVFDEDTPPMLKMETGFVSSWGGDWAWAKAPPIDLVASRGALDGFMSHVIQRFAARDMESLLPLFEPAIRDKASAYPVLDVEGLANMTLAWLADTDAESWSVLPFDPIQIDYRPAANGRLIQPLGPDGLPAIRSDWIPAADPEERPSYVALPGLIGFHEGQLRFMT